MCVVAVNGVGLVVVIDAIPPAPTMPVPSVRPVVVSTNFTVLPEPVVTLPPVEVTVAVSVTGCK